MHGHEENLMVFFQEEEIKRNVPEYVIAHGILSKPDLEKLLQDTKVRLWYTHFWVQLFLEGRG